MKRRAGKYKQALSKIVIKIQQVNGNEKNLCMVVSLQVRGWE